MRILQLSGLAGPRSLAGGVWEVARIQAEALRLRGHRVSVMSCWYGQCPSTRPGMTLSRTYSLGIKGDLRFTFSPTGLRRLFRLKSSFDVVHIHLCRDLYTTFAVMAAKIFRIPVVAQTHGMVLRPDSRLTACFDFLIFKRVLRSVDKFLVLANNEAEEIESMGVSPTKLRWIQNAVEASSCARNPAAQPNFLFASRLHVRKQPMVFVEAALKVLEEGHDATFTLAGPDYGEESIVSSRVERSIFASQIKVCGPRTGVEVRELLSTATAMVLPSRNEPYPMIALEAAAANCPIIISTDTGISELLKEEGAALVVSPDIESIAGAMIRVLQEPQMASDIACLAREVYGSNWSPDRLARTLEAEYEFVAREEVE